jgi:hypothetical protein
VLTAIVFTAALILATIAFSGGGALGGLFQRVMATSAWLWLMLLALRERADGAVRLRS